MIGLGSFSFAAPWALLGLIVVPVIWWLLKLRPPLPKRIAFPPIRLLEKLVTRRESPSRMPPWLLILRLALALVVIAALAHPLWNATTRLSGQGPIYVLVDDDWAAAGRWAERRAALDNLAAEAERAGRPMVLETTAGGAAELPPAMMSATAAGRVFAALQPKPWPGDRAAAMARLLSREIAERPGDVVWLSNGLADGTPMKSLAEPLRRLGATSIVSDPPSRTAVVLRPPRPDGENLKIVVERAVAGAVQGYRLRALADDGQLLAQLPVVFDKPAVRAEALLKLPTELRNRLARLELADVASAAAVVLIDERWRRRPVGLVVDGDDPAQPLLGARHYLSRALTPYTEVRTGGIAELLTRPPAVLLLADPGPMKASVGAALDLWLERGGVVVRFAGPRLARAGDGESNRLLPVKLRRGGRMIGGAMSWRKPETLAPFEQSSPFYGLTIPKDVTVRRQVLAEPALDLAERTWARLRDGTPLVTAAARGGGWLILVHTSASAEWSNLPLSGLFVDMLRWIVGLSQGVAGAGAGDATPLPPLRTIDAFARMGPPPASATAVTGAVLGDGRVTASHPPGFYGTETTRRALNLSAGLAVPSPLGPLPSGVAQRPYERSATIDLKPWLLALALALFVLDTGLSLALRGLLRSPIVASLALAVAAVSPADADDTFALDNSLETRLAYVLTGDEAVDETSRAGLSGLNLILKRRTAAELGPPQGVHPGLDELAFFPLLYWPVVGDADLNEGAAARVNAYLRNGGTILFDTRDQGVGASGPGISDLARQLDIPRLVPVSRDHVLTRSFYLLQDFPGRWSGGTLWVERAGERINDGVSPIIAGAHDWAAAWAIDEAQRPMFAVVPGGERQREMAYRFGVNLVMYTLTGNYKADQVHLPAIIQRLGQ